MKALVFPAVTVLLLINASILATPLGITVSSDAGSDTTELRYYDMNAVFVGDTNNVPGVFTSIAAGDFDSDGYDEIVAARHVQTPTVENDLYYFEFQARKLYYDTSNLVGGLFTSVASGNFDEDLEDEVAATIYTGTGVPGDLYNTELLLYQPGTKTSYKDSTNDDGRFMSVTTGNLDSDPQDEMVVVKLHEDGLATQIESEFWIADEDFLKANGDPRNLLVMDLTPNRYFDLTDAAIGNFNNGSTAANIAITSDRRNHATAPETSRAEFFVGDTDAATVSYAFDQQPKRTEGMVGIATANLDNDDIDDMAIILNKVGDSGPYSTLEIYHGNGISKSPTSVEYHLTSNSQAIAVDTGDLDSDGLDEIVVLYDLLDGTSRIVTFDIDPNFELTVLNSSPAFTGTGTDVAIVVPAPTSEGDLDGDGKVDDIDLNLLLSGFDSPPSFQNKIDLHALLSNFGRTDMVAGNPVPEPNTALLLAIGMVGLFTRFRRKRK